MYCIRNSKQNKIHNLVAYCVLNVLQNNQCKRFMTNTRSDFGRLCSDPCTFPSIASSRKLCGGPGDMAEEEQEEEELPEGVPAAAGLAGADTE